MKSLILENELLKLFIKFIERVIYALFYMLASQTLEYIGRQVPHIHSFPTAVTHSGSVYGMAPMKSENKVKQGCILPT